MREAFTYMFKDKRLCSKALTYTILSFCAYFLINYSQLLFVPSYSNQITITQSVKIFPYLILFAGLAFKALTGGYYLNTISAINKQCSNYVLPFFNIKTCFLKGIKLLGSIILIMVTIGALLILSGPIKYYTFILVLFMASILSLSFLWLIAVKEKYFIILHINEAIKLIKNNAKPYFKYLLTFWGAFLISYGLSIASATLISKWNAPYIELSTISLIYGIIDAYFIFVYSFTIAKSIKEDSVV